MTVMSTFLLQEGVRAYSTSFSNFEACTRESIKPLIRALAEDGTLERLLREMRDCRDDGQRIMTVVRRFVEALPEENRKPVVEHLYGATRGQGIVHHAFEAILMYYL